MKKFMCVLASTLLTMLLSVSMCFAYSERVKVTHIEHYKIVVKRDNGAKFELRIGNGCPAIWNYKKQDVILRSDDKFMGHNSRIVLKRENQQCPIKRYARIQAPKKQQKKQSAYQEKVKVTHIEHYKIVVKRDNGAKFELRIGNGCPAIWNYNKRDVILRSGNNKFLGNNSKIVLKRENQQCPVTSYARIKGPNK